MRLFVGLTAWHFKAITRIVIVTWNNFEWPLFLVIRQAWVAEFLADHSLGVIKESLIVFNLLDFGWRTHKFGVDVFVANHRWRGKMPLAVLDDFELATFAFLSYGPIGDA